MNRRPALFGLLAALANGPGLAATAYVSDDLVLGVYSEQDSHGSRLATLHSGMSVETQGTSGEFSKVRLGDGRTGWVKSSYLTGAEPAALRVKRLEEELSRFRATTPALAAAAANTEVARLQQELAATQARLQSALGTEGAARGAGAAIRGDVTPASRAWLYVAGAAAALLGAFYLGYATLAHRVKQKFGGIKVY